MTAIKSQWRSHWKCIKSFQGLEKDMLYTLPVPIEFVRANKGDLTEFLCIGFTTPDVVVETANIYRYLTPHIFENIKEERKAKLQKLFK